ncbi:MAG: BamA/TamA family outer membrane protein [Deltaproteobacteria bacterium]
MRCFAVAALVVAAACRAAQYPAVPGDTSLGVSAVTIAPRAGEHLALDYKVVISNLGLRAKTLLLPERAWNPYRLAEDRRRLAAFLMESGRFEAAVDEPQLAWNPAHTSVAVAWTVHEGPAYTIGSVEIRGAPPELAGELRAMVPFGPGDRVDMPVYRPLRFKLADKLQEHGYGHARGYSRAFVDRTAKTVAWFYYLDPGPPTTIKSVSVEGNTHVPTPAVLERAGLAAGQPYSTTAARRAELALLDSGSFASVNVTSDADVPHLPEWPEFGGVIAPDQIGADGSLVPRPLPAELAVRVVVVESPRDQLRGELGVEADPTRIDSFTSAHLILRDLFAPQHHLVLAASAGYGWILGDDHRAEGFYGSALAEYVHSLDVTDVRMTARWRDVLYPWALLRELVAGPGLHRVLAPGVFVDGDAFLRFGRQLDQPALVMPAAELELAPARDSTGLDLEASVIADRRDDRVEPKRGWLLGAGASYSPGGAVGDHRWLQLTGDARAFVPVGDAWSLGLRASGGWVGLGGDGGIPLGPRLFGGGAYGMRGFGRDQLSPAVGAVLVGGRSLVESTAELRWLPFRKQVGAAAFVDAGQAGAGANPFADGISVAAGAGFRLRLWYLPIALDLAYRLIDSNHAGLAWNRVLAFVRVGEAF